MTSPDRYAGRPFLKLVESYVLHLIGEMPDALRQQLHALEPHLRRIYKRDGAWFEIIEAELDISHFPV